jgi:hypothetical protein
MRSELKQVNYRLDPGTLGKLAEIREYLETQAIPGTPPLTDVAAVRHAIHLTHASIPKRRKKFAEKLSPTA